jgi:hypothetical protein
MIGKSRETRKYHELLHLHSRELNYTFKLVSYARPFDITSTPSQPGKDRRRVGGRLGGKGCKE